jgi:hypothetical protein
MEDNTSIDHLITTETMAALTSTGMPPHILQLKVGMPVILMRNLNIAEGLVNGQVLIIEVVHPRFMKARIASGRYVGNLHGIPTIVFISPPEDNGFTFRRVQLPVLPAFAITIHKSQGQTLRRVGLYCKNPVLTHGQLYVALSRVRTPSDVRLCIPDDGYEDNESGTVQVYNVVTRAVISSMQSFG